MSSNLALDDSQKRFCKDPHPLIRLLAPAGSGKTHSLLWRCLFLSQAAGETENVRFLVFTFTRAARDELRDRLKSDPNFEPIKRFVEITTLNAWGLRRLKSRLNNLRLVSSQKDKKILMLNPLQPVWKKYPKIEQVMTDSRRKMRGAQVIMDLLDKLKSFGFHHDKHNDFRAFAKHVRWMREVGMGAQLLSIYTDLEDLEIIHSNPFANLGSFLKTIGLNTDKKSPEKQMFENFFGFWREAILQMYEMAMLTLDDQKYWAFIDLKKDIAERRFTKGVHRYHHILVDEFQDINPLDLALLKKIALVNKAKLCIVGDDDQAIFEWRGATPQFILNPDNHIEPGYKTYVLERNYRSPKNIVRISQQLIGHNRNRVSKNMQPVSTEEAQIEVVKQPSLEMSVNYVLDEVKTLLNDKEIRNIAIISRKRSQLIPYQIVFAGNDIPFYAAEDLNVLLSETFNGLKDMLALQTCSDQRIPFAPDPTESLLKLCDKVKHYPLSKKDRESLKNYLISKRPRSLREALEKLLRYTGQLKSCKNQDGMMSVSFYHAINEFLCAENVADAIRAISENFAGLQKDYAKSLDDIFYADPPFSFLSEYAKRYGDDFSAFYEDVEKAIATLAKIPPDDEDQPEQDESWKCPLHLMTALRAKGKEFDVVFILDCNEGIYPIKFAETADQLEAERRLFYVALTRARKRLILLLNENIFGKPVQPSPYLQECGL